MGVTLHQAYQSSLIIQSIITYHHKLRKNLMCFVFTMDMEGLFYYILLYYYINCTELRN